VDRAHSEQAGDRQVLRGEQADERQLAIAANRGELRAAVRDLLGRDGTPGWARGQLAQLDEWLRDATTQDRLDQLDLYLGRIERQLGEQPVRYDGEVIEGEVVYDSAEEDTSIGETVRDLMALARPGLSLATVTLPGNKAARPARPGQPALPLVPRLPSAHDEAAGLAAGIRGEVVERTVRVGAALARGEITVAQAAAIQAGKPVWLPPVMTRRKRTLLALPGRRSA
jgi:hypothetical protein